MTYLIGRGAGGLLKVEGDSAANAGLADFLAFALERKFPEIYAKIIEQVIFVRFDELAAGEFLAAKQEIDGALSERDLPQSVNRARYGGRGY